MSADVTEERRLVLQLLAHWDELRGERTYPGLADLDPAALGARWDSCFVLTLARPRAASAFHHLGRALRPRAMAAADGRASVADVPSDTLLGQAIGCLPTLLDKRVPVSLGGEMRLTDGLALCRSVLLPLSDDGTAIAHVLGAGNCRYLAVDEGPARPAGHQRSARREGGAGA